MAEMSMTLSEAKANCGSTVKYHCAGGVPEYGVIVDVTGEFVLVMYNGTLQAKSTNPYLLDFA